MLEQVGEAVAAGAEEIREAVMLVNRRVPLEASGGVRFDTIRAIGETGVDFISTSKLTQAAPAVDIGPDGAH